MALTACRECGQDVSDAARACPHCGVQHPDAARAREQDSTRLALQLAGIVMLVVAVCGGLYLLVEVLAE